MTPSIHICTVTVDALFCLLFCSVRGAGLLVVDFATYSAAYMQYNSKLARKLKRVAYTEERCRNLCVIEWY
jgi:hypothetical protein